MNNKPKIEIQVAHQTLMDIYFRLIEYKAILSVKIDKTTVDYIRADYLNDSKNVEETLAKLRELIY